MTDPRMIQAPSGFHEDRALRRADLLSDPIDQFSQWLADAEAADVALPHAMALATADAEGRPSVRHVLLRGLDARGFVFNTNRTSGKARDLEANPHAGLVFLWKRLDRQVCVTGDVHRTGDDEDDAYFATRPREAQLGAWASRQSAPIEDRETLEARMIEMTARFDGADVPRPPFWGGYRLTPRSIEFWQGRRHRLHDRFRYARDDDGAGWRLARLAP
jgi:pyridoxamine 5'-phosphate oxidase